jgi:hypothetical protein
VPVDLVPAQLIAELVDVGLCVDDHDLDARDLRESRICSVVTA